MAYTPYTPSRRSQGTRRRQDQATNNYSNWANQTYRPGSGGYGNEINTARDRLNNLYNNNHLSQTFTYGKQKEYDQALNNILNRKAFEYDLSNDQLFQQYKDNYQAMGKAAMADTIGQASAMTGGYGNSYATAAGAQTYNNYLQQINNSVGDFYNMALSGYNAESDRLNNAFSAVSSDRSTAQNEWASNWNVYTNLYNMYSNDYNNMLDRDASRYNEHGQNLYNLAGLYTSQHESESKNDLERWSTEQNLRAQQAQQAETERHNRATETLSRSSSTKSRNNSSPQKQNTITPKKTDKTQKYIKTFGKPENARTEYVRKSVEKLLNGGVLSAGEALYLLDYYNISE